MDSDEEFGVVLIGHLAKDKIIVDGEEKKTGIPGGAVYYGAFPLKSVGVNVAVVTRLARKDFYLLESFKQNNIPVFAKESAQTTGMENIYSSEDPDRRGHRLYGFAGPFSKDDIPALKANIFHIGALIRGEIPVDLIVSLSKKTRISLDVQGFIRVRAGNKVIFRDWERKKEVLPYVHYLKADRTEAEILTGTSELKIAARMLAEFGPLEVLITYKSGVLLYADGDFYQASFSPRSIEGRTGRGDTCMATYIGKRLTVPAAQALSFAAALTSRKLEKEGPFISSGISQISELDKLNSQIKEKKSDNQVN